MNGIINFDSLVLYKDVCKIIGAFVLGAAVAIVMERGRGKESWHVTWGRVFQA